MGNLVTQIKEHIERSPEAFIELMGLRDTYGKEQKCPICGKRKLNIFPRTKPGMFYLCTCSIGVPGHSAVDFYFRAPNGQNKGANYHARGDELVQGCLELAALLGLSRDGKSGLIEKNDQLHTATYSTKKTFTDAQWVAAEALRVEESRKQAIAIKSKCGIGWSKYLQGKKWQVRRLLQLRENIPGFGKAGDSVIFYRAFTPCGNTVIQTVQLLPEDGVKRLPKGGCIAGAWSSVGYVRKEDAKGVILTEGFSTALTLYQCAQDYIVAACHSASNLLSVAKAFRKNIPDLPIIIAADNDYGKKQNTGLLAANQVKAEVPRVSVIVPPVIFNRPTDYDDLRLQYSLLPVQELVRRQLTEPDLMPDAIKLTHPFMAACS